VAHYFVKIAVEGEALVARATRDFLEPVPAASLALAAGDDVVWFSDSGRLRLRFEQSPFVSGRFDLQAEPGLEMAPEIVAARPSTAIRYTVLLRAATRAYGATAGLAVGSRRAAGAETLTFDHGGEEVLARIPGEIRMASHSIELKKGGGKIDYDYRLNGAATDVAKAIPYLVLKKYDTLDFWSSDGAVIISYKGGSPYADGATVVWAAKGEKAAGTIKEPDRKEIVGFKYTAILVNDPDDKTKVYMDDPHIIIDNTD